MEEPTITAGNDPVKTINVQDIIANQIGPEHFISHAQPGFIATVDSKEQMREKIGKNFQSEEDFDAFHNYASNLANGYNANVDNKRKPSKKLLYYGSDRVKVDSTPMGPTTYFLPGELGGGYRISPRRIARNKGTYKFFDEESQEDVELPIDPKDLINPLNNFIIDGMDKGDPYLRKLKGSEYDPSYQRYSIWGNDEAYGGALLEPLANFGQELILSIPTLFAFAGKLGHVMDEKTNNPIGIKKITPEYEGDVWNAALNALERLKWQPSDYTMEGGWFDHGAFSKAQMWNIGGGIGLLMPQRWGARAMANMAAKGVKKQAIKSLPHVVPGRILKPMAADALEASGKTAGKVAGEAITNPTVVGRMTAATGQAASKLPETMAQYNYRVQKAMKQGAMFGSMSIGTGQALKGFWDEAKGAGVSDDDALWLTIAASPAVALTEFLLGKYLTKGIGDDMITPRSVFGDGAAMKHLKGVIKKEFGDIAAKGAMPASSEAKGFFLNTIMKKALPGMKSALDKYTTIPVVGGATFEGTQEWLEQVYYIGLQRFYNKYWAEEDGGKFHNTEGEGMRKVLKENFWAGFILGGIMDATTGSYKNKQQENFVNSMIVNGQENELNEIVKRGIEKNYFGLTGLNHLGEQMENGAPGSGIIINQQGELDQYGFARNYEIKTQNDMNAYNFIQKINITRDAFNYGVHNTDNITAYGESPSIVGEVLELSKSMLSIDNEIKDLNAKLNEAQTNNQGSVAGIKAEIASKQKDLSELRVKYEEATVPTIYDPNTKRSYTKRANEKISEVIFSEIEGRPVSIAEINTNLQLLNKYQAWKTAELVRMQEIAKKRDALVASAESLTFDGNIQNVNALITELEAQMSSGKVDEYTFNPAQLSDQAKVAYGKVLEGIETLTNDPARMAEISADPVFGTLEGIPDDARASIISQQFETQDPVLESGGAAVRDQRALMNLRNNLRDVINAPEVKNPNIDTQWDDEIESQKALQYLLSADNGTAIRDDLRAELISIGQDLENATEFELQRVRNIAAKVQEARRTIKFAETANNTAITAGRRVVSTSPSQRTEDGSMVMGNEFDPNSLFTASIILDQMENGMPDFRINENNEVELIKDEDGNVIVYPGIDQLIEKLEGTVSKRSVRENKRHRGRAYRNVHMAKYVISTIGPTVFPESSLKLATAIDAIQDIFDIKKVSDERLIQVQNIVIDLMTLMHKEINAKGVNTAKEILTKMVDSIHNSTSKFYDATTQSSIKFNYKGYTPARDNVKIEYDDFLEMEFSDFERIVEMIRVREETKGTLPEGYDYSDRAVLDAILSLWSLELTNFANTVTVLDSDAFYQNYNNVKDSLPLMPSSQQEYAIAQATGLIESNSQIQFEARRRAMDIYLGDVENDLPPETKMSVKNFPINGIFIQAINGAGKTTVMTRAIALIMSKSFETKAPNHVAKVILVSPTQKLSDKLSAQFEGLKNLNITTVLASEFEANMGKYKDADFIFYDEATRFPISKGKEFINTFSKPKTGTNKKVKFIFLGDPTQSRNGDLKASNVTDTLVGMMMSRSITVSEIFRTEVYDLARLTQILQKNIMGLRSNLEDVVLPATQYKSDFSEGVFYAVNEEEVIQRWLKDIQRPGIQRSLIVRNSLDRKNLINRLGDSITPEQRNLIRYINASKELTTAENNEAGGTIQGDETEGAYVSFAPADSDPAGLVDFKTAIGRAQKFVMLPWAKGISSASENLTKTNSDPELLKAETESKKQRLSEIAKGRTPAKAAPAATTTPAATTAKPVAPEQPKPIAPNLPSSASQSTVAEPVKVELFTVKMDGRKVQINNRMAPVMSDNNIYSIDEMYNYNGVDYFTVKINSQSGEEQVLWTVDEWNKFYETSSPLVAASEMNVQDPVPLRNLVKTALNFVQSGGSQIRFTMGSSSEIVPFTKEHYNQLNDILNNQGSYNIEVRFEKNIMLYDQTKNRKENFNVIGVYAKSDTKEVLIGTFYQPYLNEQDFANSFGKKSLSDNTYDDVQASYQQTVEDSTALNSFNTFLQTLYHRGQNSTSNVIATNVVIQANGGQAQVDYSSPIAAKGLIDSVLKKGGNILVKEGNSYKYVNKLTAAEYSKIVVQQITTDRGYVTPVFYMSYIPSSQTSDINDAIHNSVRVEINGLKYTEDTDAMASMNTSVNELVASIDKIKGEDIETVKRAIEDKINKSLLGQSMMFNRWIFRDRSISSKDTAYTIDSKYSSLLSLRGQFLNPILNERADVATLKGSAKETILKIAERVMQEGYTFRSVHVPQKTGLAFMALNQDDFKNYKTPVKDIYAPEATIISMTPNNEFGNKPANETTNDQINDEAEMLLEDVVERPEYVDVSNHINNLTEIFGSQFVRNSLEWTPNKEMFGVNAFGMVYDFKMKLYRNGNTALKGVEFHEASHYALRYFVSPESRIRILNDVIRQMREDGIGGDIPYGKASEYLSELARKDTKKRVKLPLWKRFVNWLNKVIFNVNLNETLTEQFITDLKTGKFKNAKVKYNNEIGVSYMEDSTEDTTSLSIEEELDIESMEIQDEEEGLDPMTTYMRLVEKFQSKANLNRASRMIRSAIMINSAFNPAINVRATRTLVESIDFTHERILSLAQQVNDPALTPLLERENYDALVKHILPEFMITDKMIEELFTSNYDTKDIDIKKNLSKGLQLIVRGLPKHSFRIARKNLATENIWLNGVGQGQNIAITRNTSNIINRETIDWNHLHDAMIIASQKVSSFPRFKVNGGRFTVQNSLDQWLDELKNMAIDYLKVGDNVEAANNILSFLMYADIGSDISIAGVQKFINGNSADGRIPLIRLVRDFPAVVKSFTKYANITTDRELLNLLETDEFVQLLKEKQKHASMFLNALGSYATSLINNDTSVVEAEIKQGTEANKFRPVIRKSSIVQQNKNNYNHGMEYRLYADQMIKQSRWNATSGVTNGKADYKIMPDGIYYNQGPDLFIKVLEFNGKRFEFVAPSAEFSATNLLQVARKMLSDLGINNISQSTIQRIWDSTSPTFDEFGGTYLVNQESKTANAKALSRHGLANFLGGAYTAIRVDTSYLDSLERLSENEQTQKDQIPSLKSVLSQVVGQIKATFTNEVLNNKLRSNNDPKKDIKGIEKQIANDENISIPGTFDLYLEGIAVMEAAVNKQLNNRFSVNAKGQKEFNQNLKTNIDMIYSEGMNNTHALIAELEAASVRTPMVKLPMYRLRNAQNGSIFHIKTRTKSGGSKTSWEGKSIGDYTVNDLINHDVFGHFFSSIFYTRSQKRQILSTPIPNPGDSNQKWIMNVEIDGTTNGIRLVEYDKSGKKFVIPASGRFMLNSMFDMQMDYNFEMSKIAIQQFNDVIVRRLDNNIEMNLFSVKPGDDIQTHIDNMKAVNAVLGARPFDSHMQQAFDLAGLIKDVHYTVIDGKLQLGRLTAMNNQRHHIYNFDNYVAWKGLVKEVGIDLSENNPMYNTTTVLDNATINKMKSLDTLRSQMFFRDFLDLSNMVEKGIKNGLTEPEYVANSRVEYGKNKKANFAVSEEKFMGQKVPSYNPFYESFMYLYHFISNDISANIMGDTAQMHDVTTYGKYFKGIVTQGFSPQVSQAPIYGMSTTKNSVVVMDPVSMTRYAALFGIVNEVKETDGLIFTSNISQRMYSHDLGDEMGMSRPGDKTVKSLYQSVDHTTGLGTQIKSSKLVLNEDQFDHARNEIIPMLRFMYDRPVVIRPGWVYNPFERWDIFFQQTQSMSQADQMLYNDIVNHRIATGVDVAANMISDIVMPSTLKLQSPAVNNTKSLTDIQTAGIQGNYDEFAILKTDPTLDRLMLNANQSEKVNTAAAPIQLEEIAGTMHMDAMNGMLALKNLEKEKAKWTDNTQKYLQNLLYNTIAARNDASMNIDVALNKDISMSIPFIFGTLVPNISSKLKKGIHKKAHGRKLVQEPSTFMKYVDVTEVSTGRKVSGVSWTEVLKDQQRENPRYTYDPNAPLVGMRHTTFVDQEGNDVSVKAEMEHKELIVMHQQRAALRTQIMDAVHLMNRTKKAVDFTVAEEKKKVLLEELTALDKEIETIKKSYMDSIVKVIPAQVAMQWRHHKTFGIDPSQRVSLADMFTIDFTDGTSLNVREFLKENSKDYYKSNKDGIVKLALELIGKDIADTSVVYQGLMNTRGSVDKLDILNWFSALAQSTAVFGVRVPTSLWGSSFVGEITTITYDSPSIIYTSAEKNVLDDSDYDIDQLTVLSRNIKRNKDTGKLEGFEFDSINDALSDLQAIVGEGSSALIENIKFQMYSDFMLDVNNIDKIMGTYDLDLVKQQADRISPKKTAGLNGQYNASVSNHQNSHDGKNLVAYAANAIHNVATLMHMPQSHRNQYIPGIKLPADGKITINDEFGTSQRYLILELALFLQLSVDNVKHMTAGRLNFNPATVNVAIGLLINGNSAQQVFDILTDFEVKFQTDKVLASMSIDQYTLSLHELVNNRIEYLKRENNDQFLMDRYNETKTGLEQKIEELNDQLSKVSESEVTEWFPSIEGIAVGDALNEVTNEDEAINTLDTEAILKEYKEEYAQLIKTGADNYIEFSRAQSQAKIAKMMKVKEAIEVGEAMGRISSILKYYNTLPSSHADLYSDVKRIEWITRTPLSLIPMQHDPSVMVQKVNLPTDRAFYNQMLADRIRFLQGKEMINQNVPFIAEPQEVLNNRVKSLFNRALEVLGNMKYGSRSVLDQINLQAVNGGQTGIDMAGNFATLANNIPTVVTMPQKFRHRLASGLDIFTKTKEDILDMYKSSPNMDKLLILEAGTDVQVEGNPKDYDTRTKHVVASSDHVLSLSIANSYGMMLTNKVAAGKSTILNMADFMSDEATDAAVQKYAKDLYDVAVKKINEAEKVGAGKALMVINIAGNALDTLATREITEAESFVEIETRMDKMINALGIIRSNRAMNAYFTVLKEFHSMVSDTFYQFNPNVIQLARQISVMGGGNGVLSKANFIKVVSAMDAVFAKAHLEKHYAGKLINTYVFGDYKSQVSISSSQFTTMEQLPAGRLDPKNIDQLNTFINLMPAIVEHYRTQKNNTNGFVNQLSYDTYGNIFVKDLQSMNEDQIANLRSEFARLPEELKEMFTIYNLTMTGFKNKMNSLAPVIEMSFYNDYSNSLGYLQEQFKDPDSEFTKSVMRTFAENTIVKDDYLARYLSQTKFRELSERPMYARIPVTYMSFNVKMKTDFTKLVKFNPNWTGVKSTDVEQVYKQVKNKNSNRMKGVQEFRRNQWTELETIHLTTEEQASQWANTGQVTVFTRRMHNYRVTTDAPSYVYVDGVRGFITSTTDTSVTVRKVEMAEWATAKAKYMAELKKIAKEEPDAIADVFWDSKAVYDGKPLTKKALRRLIKALKKANPAIQIEEVNNRTTSRPGVRGYFNAGTAYFNTDLITHDTPIHELMHPVLIGMINSKDETIRDMGQAFMDMAQEQIDSNSELYQAIKSAYPDLNGTDLQMEIAVTITGLVSEEKVARFVESNKTLWDNISDMVSNLWNGFNNVVRSIFNSGNTGSELDADFVTRPTEFTINSTYQDMVNNVIDMIFNGEANMVMEEIEEMNLINRMDSRVLGNDPVLLKPIEDIKGLEDELLLAGDLQNVDLLKKENMVNSIYHELLTSPDHKYTVNAEVFDFAEYIAPGKEIQAKMYIRDNIIPQIMKANEAATTSFADLLNSKDIFDAEAIKKAFTVNIDGRKVTMYSLDTIGKALSKMDFSPTSSVIKLSKLREMSSVYPGLANAFPKGFEGADPYIVIHSKKNSPNGPVYDISMFDLSAQSLNFLGKGLNAEALITDNFLDSPKARAQGVAHRADLRSARQVILAMQMMALKNNLPSVNIRKVGIIELIPFRGTRKNAGSLTYTPVNMNHIGPAVKVIADSARFNSVAPKEVRDVLANPALYKTETYNPDYLDMLMASWENLLDDLSSKGEESRGYKTIKHRLDTLHDYVNHKGSLEQLLNSIRAQKEFLERTRSLVSDSEKASNIEYRMLVMVENSLTALSQTGKKTRTNSIQKLFATTFNQPGEVVQNYHNLQRNSFSLIVDRFKADIKNLDKATKPYVEGWSADKILRLVTDTSDNYFKRMYMTEEIDGHTINLGRLHWDPKDTRTALALRNNTISFEDIKYANFILDLVEKQMKGLIRQRYLNENKYGMQLDNGEPDMDAIEKAVEVEYARNWDRGLMPVMTKTATQMIMSGNGSLMTKGLAKYFQQVANPQNIFMEMIDLNSTGESVNSIKSLFENQIMNSENNIYGGNARLRGLGLEYINGKLRVVDKAQNDAMSQNVYSTVKYLTMDAIQKEVIENDLLPAYNNAVLMGKLLDMLKPGEDYEMQLGYLTETFAANVAGKHEIAAKEEQNIKGLTAGVRLGLRAISFSGVAFSIPVAMTSLTANAYEALSNALANSVANPYGMFTIADEVKAIYEIATNFKKVKAFEDKYQTVESDRRDMLSQQKYDMTRAHIFDENVAHFMNRGTDLTARRVAMIAQALHDGSYQAHDSDGNYDVRKDKRYYNENGSQTDEQKALLKGLVKDLINDKYPGQKLSEKPLKAYSYTEQRTLEMVGTQFGVGVFGQEASAVGGNHLWYDALMQFKKFAGAAVGSRISPYMETIEGGKRKVKRDPVTGEAIRDAFGEVVTEFVKMQTEGTWRTGIRLGGEMLAASPIIGDILMKAGLVMQPRTIKEIMNLSDLEKRNLVKAALDVITFVTAYLVFTGMMKDIPDDKKKNYKKYGRLIAAVRNGFETSIIAAPSQVIDMASSIAFLSYAKRFINVVTLGAGAGKDITYLAPFGGTSRVAIDIFNEAE